MGNNDQQNQYEQDDFSSLIETNERIHTRSRIIVFISVFLILLSLLIIGCACYYVWISWKKELQERNTREYLMQQDLEKLKNEKDNLEGEKHKLEFTIMDERNKTRLLQDENAKSKQNLAEERIQNERDKAMLRNQNAFPVYYYDDDYRYRRHRYKRYKKGHKRKHIYIRR